MNVSNSRLLFLGIVIFGIAGLIGGSFAFADFCVAHEQTIQEILAKGWVISEAELEGSICH